MALEHITLEQKKELRDALQTVKSFTGIDVRQDFLLGTLESLVKYEERMVING